jgi:hypothetical protein
MAIEALPGQRVSMRVLIDDLRAGTTNPNKLLNVHWEEFHSGIERFLKAVSCAACNLTHQLSRQTHTRSKPRKRSATAPKTTSRACAI